MSFVVRDERQMALADAAIWDDIEDVAVCVVGLGRSGIAAANALARRGASVMAYDDRDADKLRGALEKLDPRVEARCGGGFIARPGEICVVSPGIGPTSATFIRVKASALRILGEVELFYRLDRAANDGCGHPIVAIGGTDGKTTTTTLIAHLLASGGRQIRLAGNIGTPLCEVVDDLAAEDIVVAEISAFQSVTCSLFRPRIAVLTNIAVDHVDYFGGDFEAYAAAKTALTDRLLAGDTFVFNAASDRLRALANRLRERPGVVCIPFSSQKQLDVGHGSDGETMWIGLGDGRAVDLLEVGQLGALGSRPPVGAHNVENALAAAAAALSMGVTLPDIRRGLQTFELPLHRMQPAGHIDRVRFINDSKATNPHAALAGLRAIAVQEDDLLVWIGGGSNKDADFSELAAELARRADCVILIGETAPMLDAALPEYVRRIHCQGMHDAVATALHEAGSQGVVLLSPACASYGLFLNYEHRGEMFMDAVERLRSAMIETPAAGNAPD